MVERRRSRETVRRDWAARRERDHLSRRVVMRVVTVWGRRAAILAREIFVEVREEWRRAVFAVSSSIEREERESRVSSEDSSSSSAIVLLEKMDFRCLGMARGALGYEGGFRVSGNFRVRGGL